MHKLLIHDLTHIHFSKTEFFISSRFLRAEIASSNCCRRSEIR